jgi:DNA-binding transcriptional MerR regulator
MGTEVTIPDKDDFKIGEVCDIATVKPFVLRYWETEFPELAPAKGAGGQRTYSRADVGLILRIKQLLYEERFTVAGAKKRLAEEVAGNEAPPAAPLDSEAPEQVEKLRRALTRTRKELEAILKTLQ